MTTVLKLGGSLLTEKEHPETVDEAALAAALDDVAAVAAGGADATPTRTPGELVLVHGGGSFGHHHADRWGVSTTDGTRAARGVSDIHGAMKRLNRRVVEGLIDRDVPAVAVHPLSVAARRDGGTLSLPLDAVETLLAEGFVPVLHGDGVAHAGEGVTVVSGDELVVKLADGLDADRVGTCSTVPGVLDEAGAVVPRVDAFEDVADLLGGSDATDVTGGMAGKVRTLLALDPPASVFGPDDLRAFLAGERPGTTVGGR